MPDNRKTPATTIHIGLGSFADQPMDSLFIASPPDGLGFARRQKIFAGHDFLSSLRFEVQAGALRNLAASLRSGLILGHPSGIGGLGNLAGGKFSSRVSALATSVKRILPSSAGNFNR